MPNTLRLNADRPANIVRAAELLRHGGTVAFPTETVYGLGANALLPEAVASIFEAKQRPAWDPLIVHIAELNQMDQVALVPEELRERVAALADVFWPGPLTLLLPRTNKVPDAVTAGRALVGVRIPRHPAALALLHSAGVPVAAPSANRFGHTSPTTAAHVLDDLDGRIDAVLDGGAAQVGVESTVLDPEAMVVYRPGAVTLGQIAAVCGVLPQMYVASMGPPESMPSPGVGIRHYAPRAKLVLCAGDADSLGRAVHAQAADAIVGVMLPDGWERPIRERLTVLPWGQWSDPDRLAEKVFSCLRALDWMGVAVIVCPMPAAGGIGDAIRDRLEKAARVA